MRTCPNFCAGAFESLERSRHFPACTLLHRNNQEEGCCVFMTWYIFPEKLSLQGEHAVRVSRSLSVRAGNVKCRRSIARTRSPLYRARLAGVVGPALISENPIRTARAAEHSGSFAARVSPSVNDSWGAIRATVLAALRIGDAGLPDNPVVRSIAPP